jgi:tRNA threonylcarbamoyladenosine biosynthesis protein TsaB
MLLLAIQTASQPYSLSILEDGRCKRHIQLQSNYAFSEDLMYHIDALLKSTELSYTDLECVAVAQGPGSYTGLRLGVSVAKTIGFVHRMPVIGVSSLEAQLMGVGQPNRLYFSVMPARKGELNCQLFSFIDASLNSLSHQYSQTEDAFVEKCKVFEKDMSICGFLSPRLIARLEDIPHCSILPKEFSGIDVGHRAEQMYVATARYSERAVQVHYSHMPLIGKSK